jgi:hypothetical protein
VTLGTESTLADREFNDPAATFKKNYGLDADALLLIRPDGYIASIATRDMLSRTTAAISRLAPPVTPVVSPTPEGSHP